MDSSNDQLDREIAEKAAAIAEKAHALEIERAELRALQRAAILRPASKIHDGSSFKKSHQNGEDEPQRARSGRGKLPGTLSTQWRNVMGRVVSTGNEARPPEAWVMEAFECGYRLDPKAVRDWLRRGVGAQMGFIERHGDTFRVADAAIEKFSFRTTEPSPEVSSNGSA